MLDTPVSMRMASEAADFCDATLAGDQMRCMNDSTTFDCVACGYSHFEMDRHVSSRDPPMQWAEPAGTLLVIRGSARRRLGHRLASREGERPQGCGVIATTVSSPLSGP